MVVSSINKLKENIDSIYELIHVVDADGNDMIIRSVKAELLKKLN